MDETETKDELVGQRQAPIVETSITKSKDGKWVIHKTIITDIKAAAYYAQVLKSEPGKGRYG